MKSFDIDLAKKGHPVCTRDGRKARIICFDCKSKERKPIIALVAVESYEGVVEYTSNGRCFEKGTEVGLDLVMSPTKHKGWVNIFNQGGTYTSISGRIYDSEKQAREHGVDYADYVDTIEIEWEE